MKGAERGTIQSMRQEVVCSLSDLVYVCIGCKHCETKVVVDLRELTKLRENDESTLGKECPGCRKDYDSALTSGLNALARAFQTLTAIEGTISFRSSI